jgi:dsRNA-specific ribonuclease
MNTANNIDQMNNILREMYSKHSFIDVERRIKYQFKDKAYLIAAFTHSSYCKNHSKINYKR